MENVNNFLKVPKKWNVFFNVASFLEKIFATKKYTQYFFPNDKIQFPMFINRPGFNHFVDGTIVEFNSKTGYYEIKTDEGYNISVHSVHIKPKTYTLCK
jgi:hypothetical protein